MIIFFIFELNNKKIMVKIGIIGGGAAGFYAAVNIALNNKDVSIVIIEKNEKPMRKLAITGGGRCNITNATFDIKELIKNYPRGNKELLSCFSKFGPAETIKWFENFGVEFYLESETNVFPKSNNAETIVNLLLQLAIENRVKIINNFSVESIVKEAGIFNVSSNEGKVFSFDKLLITTGDGKSMWKTIETLGHKIIEPVPSLFALEIKNNWLSNLAGTVLNNVSIKLANEKVQSNGIALFTHKGLSGPAVLKFSSIFARKLKENQYKTSIIVNWTGTSNIEDVTSILNKQKALHPKRNVSTYALFDFTHAFWNTILTENNISLDINWADISKKSINILDDFIVNCELETGSKYSGKDEFVTCGGVNLIEVDFKNMQSKLVENLFFAGETLDIDGFTGGYNLQAAWTTAWIASKNII